MNHPKINPEPNDDVIQLNDDDDSEYPLRITDHNQKVQFVKRA